MEGHITKRRKKKTIDSPPFDVDVHSQNPRLIKTLLKTHLALIKSTQTAIETLPEGLLSRIPFLLRSECPKIAALSAEIVGSLALSSFEANTMVASDKGIVEGLVEALKSRERRVVKAGCDAVLDLSTGSIGRERLRDASAVEALLSIYCQNTTSPTRSNAVDSTEKGISNFRIGFVKDDVLSNVVLHTAVILINTCDEVFLRKIPGELSLNFLNLLKESWGRMQSWPTPWKCHQKQSSTLSNMRANDLAETIFRLSMNQNPRAICAVDVVRRSIFGSTELEFENFIINHWEESPILLAKVSKNLEGDNIIFSLLADVFKSSTIDALLNSILRGLVSCPPINSDEMDILNFLKKVRDELGSPMLYEQDIRILKTVRSTSMSTHGPLKTEVHYPMKSLNSSNMERPEFTGIDLVHQCKKAYHEGYTVALRGVEFRWEEVAMITDRLAMLFGQPSVGANLYLTPARSQGLDRHFDDHCVFVCQLIGQKQWTVLPRGAGFLPRLYEPTRNLHCSESDGNVAEGKHFLLGEGAILYIPRGYPHEAHTLNNVDKCCIDETTELSLHLTLGIEVEPPFEWEGFAHIALHSWNLTRRQVDFNNLDSAPQILSDDIVNLLHVAIRLIGNRDPVFRKACLVAASSLPSQGEGDNHIHAHALNQRTIFAHIINEIDAHSSFLEAFGTVKVAVCEKNDDSLQWMGWLRHLPREEERIDFNDPLKYFEDLVLSYEGYINEACSAFMHVKSSFCRDVRFEDTRLSFERLLEKYRKTRKQFMKGMLSLHCTK